MSINIALDELSTQMPSRVKGVFGLEWELSTAAGWKAKRGKVKTPFVAMENTVTGTGKNKSVCLGYVDRSHSKKIRSGVSLAAMAADQFTDESEGLFIILDALPEGTNGLKKPCWFVIVTNRSVVSKTDVVGEYDQLIDMARDYVDFSPDDQVTVAGYYAADIDPTRCQMTEGVFAQLSNKKLHRYRLQGSFVGEAETFITLYKTASGVSSVVVLLSLALFAFWPESKPEQDDEPQITAEQLQQQQREEALEGRQLRIDRFGDKIAFTALPPLIKEGFGPLPINVSGWQIDGIQCDENECAVGYYNDHFGLPKALENALAQQCEVQVNAMATEAGCFFSVQDLAVKNWVSSEQDHWVGTLADWEGMRDQLLELSGTFQTGFRFHLEEPRKASFEGREELDESDVVEVAEFSIEMPAHEVNRVARELHNGSFAIGMSAVAFSTDNQSVQVDGEILMLEDNDD